MGSSTLFRLPPFFFRLFGVSALLCWPAICQDSIQAPAQDPKPFTWFLAADGYSSISPGGTDSVTLRAFDTHADTFRLNMADLDLDYHGDRFGAHLDAGYGDEVTVMASGDRMRGANTYVPQLFASYRPISGSGLQFDFGKFYTSVGAEVPNAGDNFNYSRSLLFTLGEPLYHFGFRSTIPVTKTFTAGVQLVNGWNDVEDNNRGKTFGFTSSLTESKWGWSQAYMVGPEKRNTTTGKRQLMNEVLTLNPKSSLQSYVELLYGRDKRVGPGADAWYGAAAAVRWNLNERLSLSPRVEYYIDQTGFTSGLAQHLRELTGTVQYKLANFVTARLEYRKDFSNRAFFPRTATGLDNDQATLSLALLVSFKGER